MRFRHLSIAATGMAFLLAGCGLGEIARPSPDRPCPGGVIVSDLARLTKFQPGSGRDITDVVYEARLPRLATGCEFDDGMVEVSTAVTITAARGPANRDRTADLRYFVAVVDPQDRILAKREFESNLRFPPNLDRGSITDELVQRFPIGPREDARAYAIVVGFQLTREQLAFNRTKRETGLMGPVPPRPDTPDIDMGGIDERPIYERSDDPYGDEGPPK